jgi:hypothetical protein
MTAPQSGGVWPLVLPRLSHASLAVLACVSHSFRELVDELKARDVARGQEVVLVLAPTKADAAVLSQAFDYVASCPCGGCSNETRVSVPLQLRQDSRRGWAVHAAALIPQGQLVCLYVGEIADAQEARQRQLVQDARRAANYILTVREHFNGGQSIATAIDPTRRGNVGRFINHACDGGSLEVRLVRDGAGGDDHPSVAFFAARNIAMDSELTYSYGSPTANGVTPCFCGTAACLGTLPSDDAAT